MHYFFDLTVNGDTSSDTLGSEFASNGRMRSEAIRSLMAIANDEATESDSQEFKIVVRDAEGPVYSAAVLFEGGFHSGVDNRAANNIR